jgi:hypothetical protein
MSRRAGLCVPKTLRRATDASGNEGIDDSVDVTEASGYNRTKGQTAEMALALRHSRNPNTAHEDVKPIRVE